MHGYGITNLIQRISDAVLEIEEGSLSPALHKMEHEGWITSEWARSDTNRRVRYYYKLTPTGERQLLMEERLTGRARQSRMLVSTSAVRCSDGTMAENRERMRALRLALPCRPGVPSGIILSLIDIR